MRALRLAVTGAAGHPETLDEPVDPKARFAYPLKVSNLSVVSRIEQDPATYVRECSTVLREFNHLTQDSGNVSWLVESAGQRLFVKTAGTTAPPVADAPVPYFDLQDA